MHCTILIFVYIIRIALSAIVTWLPNTSFNVPINFKDGEIPCSKQTVVFPEYIAGAIHIESETSVAGFILPLDGEIFLSEGAIELGPTEDQNCTTGNVYYMEKSIAYWSQPDVWSSPKFNKATPDAERVPCYNDIVEFPTNSTFTVTLPDYNQRVQGIIVGGEYFYTSDFQDYVTRQSNPGQQFILNQYQDIGVIVGNPYCKSRSGCSCQNNVLEIDCTAKFCDKPSCVDPIQPIGHCCKICGGALTFDIDQSFEMMQFEELVERIIETYGKDDLLYHIGIILHDKVQLVVVDKTGYDQTSAEVVNTISYNMNEDLGKHMQVSGSPLYKSGLGGKIFISVFFAVVFVMASIYIYYYKIPNINYPILMGRSQPGMFSRFNRRTDSVVSLTRRDSVGPMGVSTATAFRNPLYDSKRGRVTVVESVMEE